jgi:hypothetical protein
VKAPESQDLGRGELAELLEFEMGDTERVADRVEQLEDLPSPAINALKRCSHAEC